MFHTYERKSTVSEDQRERNINLVGLTTFKAFCTAKLNPKYSGLETTDAMQARCIDNSRSCQSLKVKIETQTQTDLGNELHLDCAPGCAYFKHWLRIT